MKTFRAGALLCLLLLVARGHDGKAADQLAAAPSVPVASIPEVPWESASAKQSIKRGFDFVIAQIRQDGTIASEQGGRPDLGLTSIAGLAFLSEGSTPRAGRYSRHSKKLVYGTLALLRQRLDIPPGQEPITLIQTKIGRNADLFLAALFLAEVYGEAGLADEAIRVELRRLIDRICKAQLPDGTWGDDSWAPVLGSVLGWECLRSAHSAGFAVNALAREAGGSLLKKLSDQKLVKGNNWMHTFYKEAACLRVLRSLQLDRDPVFDETVKRLLGIAQGSNPYQQAGGEEFLAFYLVSECLMKDEQPERASWQPLITPKIITIQNRDGSWTGHHCITDRTFCTSCALLTLMAPKLHLPISDL